MNLPRLLPLVARAAAIHGLLAFAVLAPYTAAADITPRRVGSRRSRCRASPPDQPFASLLVSERSFSRGASTSDLTPRPTEATRRSATGS